MPVYGRIYNSAFPEAEEYLGKLRKDRKVGYLFENMKKMDIQEERRKTEEQRQRAEKAEQEKEQAKQDREKAEREKKEAEEKNFQVCVETVQEMQGSFDVAKKKLMEKFSLDEAAAEEKARIYWIF